MEYETIGVVAIVIGLVSAQIQMVNKKNDREHDKLWKAVVKIAHKVGVNLTDEVVN